MYPTVPWVIMNTGDPSIDFPFNWFFTVFFVFSTPVILMVAVLRIFRS